MRGRRRANARGVLKTGPAFAVNAPIVVWHEDGPELILPLHAKRSQANDEHWTQAATREREQQIYVLAHLRHFLRTLERERIDSITYTRIGPCELDEHDNLRATMKHFVDITSAWVLKGEERIDWKNLGRFDGQLKQRGRVRWNYEQRSEPKGRMMLVGVSIRFRICSTSAAATSKPSLRCRSLRARWRQRVRWSTRMPRYLTPSTSRSSSSKPS